ncbi:MAG: hypothetical protein WCT28_04645 [Patescibacteria group bacterium]|jgi:hypothetical protein
MEEFQIKKIGQESIAVSVAFQSTGKLLIIDGQPDNGAYWLLYNGERRALVTIHDEKAVELWPFPSELEAEEARLPSQTSSRSTFVHRNKAGCIEILLSYLEEAISIINGWSDPLSEDPFLKLTRTSVQGRIGREREGDLEQFLQDILSLDEVELWLYEYRNREAVQNHLSRLQAIFAWEPQSKENSRYAKASA